MLQLMSMAQTRAAGKVFQWAPTLGGECYTSVHPVGQERFVCVFQWAPTLGGECYWVRREVWVVDIVDGFNGHPPLGVNAT